MSKLALSKPLLIMLYGFPGSGKSYFARQFADELQLAHLSSDRIRSELFEEPSYSKDENNIVDHLMEFMAEEFLRAGVSVVYDANVARFAQRRALRDMARKLHSNTMLIWLQIDAESAFNRSRNRDRRKSDDKYSAPIDHATFNTILQHMQMPKDEDYVVISGKHTFGTQRSSILKKLYDLGYLSGEAVQSKIVKPELINLVPKINPMQGRVDMTRRNISIR